MNLFNFSYSLYQKMSRDFKSMAAARPHSEGGVTMPVFVYPISMGEGEDKDKSVSATIVGADNMSDDVLLDKVAAFCARLVAEAVGKACAKSGKPNPLVISKGDKPGEINARFSKEGFAADAIPARLALNELEGLEKLFFSGWKEVKVQGERECYMVKTFNTPDEMKMALHYMQAMAEIYGLEIHSYRTRTGNEERDERTRLLPKKFLTKLARCEETLEFSQSMQ